MFDFTELPITGAFKAKTSEFEDDRGAFLKVFNQALFAKAIPDISVEEAYITSSHAGVLRGMHFQIPPEDHFKIVTCLSGKALDVIVDLRKGSNYGAVTALELSPGGDADCVVLPKGVAHGFYAQEDNTKLLYQQSTGYAPDCDRGILWSSIDFDWPQAPAIISKRDLEFPQLANFESPF